MSSRDQKLLGRQDQGAKFSRSQSFSKNNQSGVFGGNETGYSGHDDFTKLFYPILTCLQSPAKNTAHPISFPFTAESGVLDMKDIVARALIYTHHYSILQYM